MSAPSDGARADARKRLAAAEVVAPDERIARILLPLLIAEYGADEEMWTALRSLKRISAALAGVIADAKAEALREAADLYRSLGDSLPICAGHVVAELDIRADDWARR